MEMEFSENSDEFDFWSLEIRKPTWIFSRHFGAVPIKQSRTLNFLLKKNKHFMFMSLFL